MPNGLWQSIVTPSGKDVLGAPKTTLAAATITTPTATSAIRLIPNVTVHEKQIQVEPIMEEHKAMGKGEETLSKKLSTATTTCDIGTMTTEDKATSTVPSRAVTATTAIENNVSPITTAVPNSTQPQQKYSQEQSASSSQLLKCKDLALSEPEREKRRVIGKTPTIIPYGGANVFPTVDSNYMKSFNSRVPLSEQYGNILNKNKRILEFDDKRRKKEARIKLHNATVADIMLDDVEDGEPESSDAALKQYIKAKKLVETMYGKFQSEYKRQFLDWTKALCVADEDIVEVPIKIISPSGKTTFVPKGEKNGAIKTTKSVFDAKTMKKDIGIEVQPPVSASTTQTTGPAFVTTVDSTATTKSIATGLPDSSYDAKTKVYSTGFPLVVTKVSRESGKTEKVVHPLRVMNEMIPAGVIEKNSFKYHEKRHFPVGKDSIQLQIEELEQSLLKSFVQEDPLLNIADYSSSEQQHLSSSASLKNRKHHKPESILKYALETPSTLQLAQSILARSQERQQKNNGN